MIVYLDLRRKGELLVTKVMLKLLQERYNLPFHRVPAVLDVSSSLLMVLACDQPRGERPDAQA